MLLELHESNVEWHKEKDLLTVSPQSQAKTPTMTEVTFEFLFLFLTSVSATSDNSI